MSIGISLGWNCESVKYGIDIGIRKTKQTGYTTCVFDLMVTNYPGVISCLKNNFRDFLIPKYLITKQIGNEIIIYHTKYNFWFNHESPGHANLYQIQNWKNGKYHFVNNNFQKFIERYKKRIDNFRKYLYSGKHIQFIIERYNANNVQDISELNEIIKQNYPKLKYNFTFVPHLHNPLHTLGFSYIHLIEMGFTENDDEIKRLFLT